MKKMQAYQIQDDWKMENIRLVELDIPEPGPGQVLLRMRAASLNYRDLLVPLRGYGSKTGELPLIPVSDGVGEIVALGRNVTRLVEGDRACPLFMPKWQKDEPSGVYLNPMLGGPLDGVMAEYVVADETAVCRVPGYLTDAEASTLPVAALTAWSALHTYGKVKPGDRILVQGSGGVSLFALQLALAAGCRVFVTSGSDEKLQRLLDMGAETGLNYNTDRQWGTTIRTLAGGDGVDHIVEVGGEHTLAQSLRAIRIGGTISLIGVLSGANLNIPLGAVVTRHICLRGITVGHREGFRSMCQALEKYQLKPIVDRVFDFNQLHEALDYLSSGRHFGKICLSFS